MLTINTLINQLKSLIQQSRNQAYRAVDSIQVQTYWQIGRHILEVLSNIYNSERTAFRIKPNNPTLNP
jgi:DNA-directed RNA polymerase